MRFYGLFGLDLSGVFSSVALDFTRSIMNSFIGVFVLVCLLINSCRLSPTQTSAPKFYGKDSKRAHMLIEGIELRIPIKNKHFRKLSAEKLARRYSKKIKNTRDVQLKHLFGAFTQHTTPFNFQENPAIPRGKPTIPQESITYRKSKTSKELIISYDYYDIVVFKNPKKTGKDIPVLDEANLTSIVVDGHGESHHSVSINFYLPLRPGEEGEAIYAYGCPQFKAEYNDYDALECTEGDQINRCTDLHYQLLGDFWYFWNPTQMNDPDDIDQQTWDEIQPFHKPYECKIPKTELYMATANFVPIANTSINKVQTHVPYPDYDDLLGLSEDKVKKVKITYLLGVDERKPSRKENYYKLSDVQDIKKIESLDLGHFAFLKAFEIMVRGKGSLKLEQKPECLDTDIAYEDREDDCLFTTGELKYLPQDQMLWEDLTDPKKIKNLPKRKTQIQKWFGESWESKKELKNKRFLRWRDPEGRFEVYLKMQLFNPDDLDNVEKLGSVALTKNDIVIYDGHSGLGGFWAADNFFKQTGFNMPVDKYQVLFFNGCSTFAYYNHDYFHLKSTDNDPSGRRNLDVLTNGIGAEFTIGAGTDSLLIKKLTDGSFGSWVDIVGAIYAVEPNASALTQVNGDELSPRGLKLNEDDPAKICKLGFKPDFDKGWCYPTKKRMLNPFEDIQLNFGY